MEKIYERINWHNLPQTTTPINETNLNRMDNAIDIIDSRVVALDTDLKTNYARKDEVPVITNIQTTLLANAWSGNVQTIEVEGMTATRTGLVGLAIDATPAERQACRNAILVMTGQGADSITITADGTVPSINLPINILML